MLLQSSQVKRTAVYTEICKDDYGIVEEFRMAMPSDLFGCCNSYQSVA